MISVSTTSDHKILSMELVVAKIPNQPYEGRINAYLVGRDGRPSYVPDKSIIYSKAYSSIEESDAFLTREVAGFPPVVLGVNVYWYGLDADPTCNLTTRRLTQCLQSGVFPLALEEMAASLPLGQGTLHLISYLKEAKPISKVSSPFESTTCTYLVTPDKSFATCELARAFMHSVVTYSGKMPCWSTLVSHVKQHHLKASMNGCTGTLRRAQVTSTSYVIYITLHDDHFDFMTFTNTHNHASEISFTRLWVTADVHVLYTDDHR